MCASYKEHYLKKHMIAVDCFSGCGGSACGLLISGFDVVLGIENNVEALGVYRSNHKHATSDIDLGNVELAVETIRSNVGRVPDLLAGSPPCQDFSSSGGRVEGESIRQRRRERGSETT